MSLIDSDMFYWRQKKCFRMIDKVKNVTTLIIYCSALEKKKKLQSQNPFTSFIRCDGERMVNLTSPFRQWDRTHIFNFLTKLCIYVDKGDVCNVSAAHYKTQNVTLPPVWP